MYCDPFAHLGNGDTHMCIVIRMYVRTVQEIMKLTFDCRITPVMSGVKCPLLLKITPIAHFIRFQQNCGCVIMTHHKNGGRVRTASIIAVSIFVEGCSGILHLRFDFLRQS